MAAAVFSETSSATAPSTNISTQLACPFDTSTLEVLRRPVESTQFTSWAFSQKVREAGLAPSMGSVGSAYDNAVAETFFATLKKELIHRRSWPNKQELRTEVFAFVEGFCNRRRRHSYLGWLSPVEFEGWACPARTGAALG